MSTEVSALQLQCVEPKRNLGINLRFGDAVSLAATVTFTATHDRDAWSRVARVSMAAEICDRNNGHGYTRTSDALYQ